MFIIWGTTPRQKQFNIFVNDACGVCHVPNRMVLMEYSRWFTLFFIPIFKISKQYFLVCPNCRASRKLTKEEGRALIDAHKNGGSLNETQVRASAPVQNIEAMPAESVSPAPATNSISVEDVIKDDISKVLSSIKDPNVLQDSSNFNKLYNSLKSGLTSKYGDAALVEKVLNEYFGI